MDLYTAASSVCWTTCCVSLWAECVLWTCTGPWKNQQALQLNDCLESCSRGSRYSYMFFTEDCSSCCHVTQPRDMMSEFSLPSLFVLHVAEACLLLWLPATEAGSHNKGPYWANFVCLYPVSQQWQMCSCMRASKVVFWSSFKMLSFSMTNITISVTDMHLLP